MSATPSRNEFRGWGLPLLAHDLAQQAGRPGTYVLRVVYTFGLFAIVIWFMVEALLTSGLNPFAYAGQGRRLLTIVAVTQFTGIYLILPAASAGTIAREKELNTLTLLCLTRLGPWTIVFEKILGKLVPAIMLVLVSLPILALAYTFGGFSAGRLAGTIWLLVLAAAEVAALSVMFSAWFSKTSQAFALTVLCMAGVPTALFVAQDMAGMDLIELVWGLVPPILFLSSGSMTFADIVRHSLPAVAATVCFVVLARWFLVWRAFTTESSDRVLFRNLPGRISKSVRSLLRPGRGRATQDRSLPGDRPFVWWDSRRTATAHPRDRWYVLAGLMTVLLPILVVLRHPRTADDEFLCLWWVMFGLSILVPVTSAATAFSTERSGRTMELMLTLPITGQALVREKISAAFACSRIFLIPMLVVVAADVRLKQSVWQRLFTTREADWSPLFHTVSSVVTLLIYVSMLTWLGMLSGLWFRRPVRSIVATIVAIVIWCLGPLFVILSLLETLGFRQGDPIMVLALTSPIAYASEQHELHRFSALGHSPWTLLVVNSVIYGAALFALRSLCLIFAEQLLRGTTFGANPERDRVLESAGRT